MVSGGGRVKVLPSIARRGLCRQGPIGGGDGPAVAGDQMFSSCRQALALVLGKVPVPAVSTLGASFALHGL